MVQRLDSPDMHVSIFHILSRHSRGTYRAPTLLEADYTAKYEWDVSNKFNQLGDTLDVGGTHMWTWQGFNMQFFKKLWGHMCIASNILDSKSKYDGYMILVIHVL